jgi:hypothetical protein
VTKQHQVGDRTEKRCANQNPQQVDEASIAICENRRNQT